MLWSVILLMKLNKTDKIKIAWSKWFLQCTLGPLCSIYSLSFTFFISVWFTCLIFSCYIKYFHPLSLVFLWGVCIHVGHCHRAFYMTSATKNAEYVDLQLLISNMLTQITVWHLQLYFLTLLSKPSCSFLLFLHLSWFPPCLSTMQLQRRLQPAATSSSERNCQLCCVIVAQRWMSWSCQRSTFWLSFVVCRQVVVFFFFLND